MTQGGEGEGWVSGASNDRDCLLSPPEVPRVACYSPTTPVRLCPATLHVSCHPACVLPLCICVLPPCMCPATLHLCPATLHLCPATLHLCPIILSLCPASVLLSCLCVLPSSLCVVLSCLCVLPSCLCVLPPCLLCPATLPLDCLKECHRQIENWTQNNGEGASMSASTTPTDMREVMF
ncbi:hypothetical protein Hamer_G016178 [Homarus americanus]|uniref:Uncharacterized protein n=1 Tax=Homarus americanus TaxID=6706 RepID=A0A8J5N0T9_HOMAM|nr:hypothetical protein Hamer_G016178 [Homarus americanus]